MKRKIENYLNSKDKNEYSNLDKIFELYLSGDIKKLLSKYAGIEVHPTFLYESIWCFCLFWFLLWMDKKHKKFDGQILCLYGILYSVERFCVEGLRTDSLMFGPLRQAQLISLAIIIVLAAVYFILHKKNNKI